MGKSPVCESDFMKCGKLGRVFSQVIETTSTMEVRWEERLEK